MLRSIANLQSLISKKRTLARHPVALLAALALVHGLLYAWLVPPWQAPDETTQFEYAALISRLGFIPAATDSDPELERQIVASLVRQRFFEYLIGHPPAAPPQSLDDVRTVFFMPRQVGNDPPLYFIIAALPIRALAGQPVETQLMALRLLGVLFTAGAALCTYGAGHELCAGQPPKAGGRMIRNIDLTYCATYNTQCPARADLPLAAGLLVALQPMFVFVGAAAGNDGLANLIGAAICWTALRSMRLGLSPRRAMGLLALVLLGALTKRTLLAQALLLALIGVIPAIRLLVRGLPGRGARLGLGGALLLALALGTTGVLTSGRVREAAAEWSDLSTAADAPRTLAAPGTGRPALIVRPGATELQVLPGIAAEWAQNQELRFSARIWAAEGTATGYLVIDFGWAATEVPFKVGKGGKVIRMHTFIPLYCPIVLVAVRSEVGTVYVDQLRAESDRRPGFNLLANGDIIAAGLQSEAPLAQMTRYLRLREIAWLWRSGRLLEPPPLGWGLARLFFVSFWGQFGWMSLPLVIETPWEPALWLVCAGGVLGAAGWLARVEGPSWRRRAVLLLVVLALAGLLLPLLNAYTQTREQVIQQGRYLFPAMAPVALLLALGWRAFLPPRWRPAALPVWVGWWALFAAAALALVVRFY